MSYLHYLNNQNEFAYGGEVNPPEGEDLGMSKEDFIRRVKTGKSSIPTQALQNQVDFLNHPFYQQNARNVWGEDANQNIANQIDRMKSAKVTLESNLGNAAGMFHPPGIMKGNERGHIKLLESTDPSEKLHTMEHELGHASDTGKASHWWDYNDPARTYITDDFDNVVQRGDEDPLAKMEPEFGSYYDLTLTNPYYDSQDPDYLKVPTEFRTRLNHVKKLMANDNFNWNEKSAEEIANYMQEKKLDNNISDAARSELQQFSQYNREDVDQYLDYGDVYRDFLSEENRKGKEGKDFRKLWRQGVRTPEEFINAHPWYKKMFHKEEIEQILEDKDGDGKADFEILDDYKGRQQNRAFLDKVFKELAQEKNIPDNSYRVARNGGKPYPGPPYYPYHSANLKVDKSYDKNHVQPSVFPNGGELVTIGDKTYNTSSKEYRKLVESGKVKPYTTDTKSGIGAFDYGNLPDFEVTAPTQEAVDMAKSAFNRSKQGQAKQQNTQNFLNNNRYRYPESGATKGIVESMVEGVIDNPNNLSYYPGAGELYDAAHLGYSLRQGNYGDAAFDAAAFTIPFVGGAAIKKFVKPYLKNAYKYNPFATNLESKIAKENLLARQIYGDEAYENFLKHGPATEYGKNVPRHKQIHDWLNADVEDVSIISKGGKNEGKLTVASTMTEDRNFKYPYFQKGNLFFGPNERALYNADMGKGRVIIPKDVNAKSFYPAGETSFIRNVDTAPESAVKRYSGEKHILSPFDKNAFNPKAFDVYEETPHWLMGNRKIQRHGGPTDPDKEYLKNWNKARLKTGRFNDQLGSGRIEGLNQNIDEVERVSRAEMSKLIGENPNSRGMYYRDPEKGMHTYFSEPTFLQELTNYFGGMPQTNLHELTHAMTKASSHIPGEESTGQIKAIQNIPLGTGEYYGSKYSKMSPEGKYDVGPYGYDGDAEEILAQLMEYRKNFNVDPNRIFTEDDIEEVMENVKKQGARGLFGLEVYKPKELIRLMNEVAMVDDKKSDINMARNGGPTDPPKKELEIQPAVTSTTYVDKPVFDRNAFSAKIVKELGIKPDTSNEKYHETAKSYVENEKVIDREPISGLRSLLPYPCYDYTCVELLKDADKDIGRNSIPGNINNNRQLREYLLNNPNYTTVHRDSTKPGDLIQYYDPASNNYPYHAGIVDTDSSYISSGGGTPYFPIGNPVEVKGLKTYNTLDGDQPGTEWYGESKDPYYAYRYIEQD